MSDKSMLANTGAGGAIAIGSTVVTGQYILAVAAGVVLVGALLVRFGFRRGRQVDQG